MTEKIKTNNAIFLDNREWNHSYLALSENNTHHREF